MGMQIITNGCIHGLLIALVALGLLLTRYLRGFYDFSHGAVFMIGGYVAYSAVAIAGLDFVFGAVFGVVASALFAWGLDWIVFQPLRLRTRNQLQPLVASLGVLLAAAAGFGLLFSEETISLPQELVGDSITISGIHLASGQMAYLIWGAPVLFVYCLVWRLTRIGLVLRAIADNQALAKIKGVDRGYMSLLGLIAGAVTGGLAGVLQANDVGIAPTGGMEILLVAIVVVVLAERYGLFVLVGLSLLFGVVRQASVYALSTGWDHAFVFFMLAIFLWKYGPSNASQLQSRNI